MKRLSLLLFRWSMWSASLGLAAYAVAVALYLCLVATPFAIVLTPFFMWFGMPYLPVCLALAALAVATAPLVAGWRWARVLFVLASMAVWSVGATARGVVEEGVWSTVSQHTAGAVVGALVACAALITAPQVWQSLRGAPHLTHGRE